jgi:hypothetical protein
MNYDLSTIATLRRALDEVFLDERFHHCRAASALEIAEHLLAEAASGERDLERLKSSAFEKVAGKHQTASEPGCLKRQDRAQGLPERTRGST